MVTKSKMVTFVVFVYVYRENIFERQFGNDNFKYESICIGYHMRGEVISVLSLERRYHSLSRVSAANEGQNMIL